MSTSAERQAQYIARLKAKAALFDRSDEARRRVLQQQFQRNDEALAGLGAEITPEERHARAFFLAHPLCTDFPITDTGCRDALPNGIGASFRDYADEFDMAAFAIAVREVSSVRLELRSCTDAHERSYAPDDAPIRRAGEEVKRIAEELRALGLWGKA